MNLCGNKHLLYDEACFHIFNYGTDTVHLLSQVSECYKCDYLSLVDVEPNTKETVIVSTVFPLSLRAISQDVSFCNYKYLFRQKGSYGINITNLNCSSIYGIEPPDDVYEPLWTELWVLLTVLVVWAVGSCIGYSQWFNQYLRTRNAFAELQNDLGVPTSTIDSVPLVQSEFVPNMTRFRSRVKSLDTFRGITITLMLFVNYGGGKYWFFKHATWNGLTVADIVFPWFCWIMGVSIVMSVRSQLRVHSSRWKIFLKCLHRTMALLTMGLILNSWGDNNLQTLRIPGVLQRLALSYFIVSSLEIAFMKPQNNNTLLGRFIIFQDIFCAWVQWLIMIGLVFVYYCLTMLVSVGGCPKGYLGPGGLSDHGKYFNCTGGTAGYIDRIIFQNQHLYNHPTPRYIYQTELPYDPEGLLGTLSTSVTVFLGAQAGRILLCYSYTQGRIKRWLIWAILTGALAGHLCGWSKEDGMIPVNKNLWSLSFVLCTASFAFIMMTVLFLIVDHAQWWTGTPFQESGKNSIFMYIGSELTRNMLPWTWEPFSDKSTHTEFLIMHTWGTTLWILIAFVLNKRDIFITV